MSCDIGEVTERLENEQSFIYVTAHSPTFPLLLLRHNSFSNPSFAFPTSQALHLIHLASSFSNRSVTFSTSQLILQPFRRFTYVTVHSPTLPLRHLRHSLFTNPSFASPTSQALHLIHLASRPSSGPTRVPNSTVGIARRSTVMRNVGIFGV